MEASVGNKRLFWVAHALIGIILNIASNQTNNTLKGQKSPFFAYFYRTIGYKPDNLLD